MEEKTKLAVKRIDEIAASAMELFKSAGSFEHELAVAEAMSALRTALTPELMRPVMALMNTALGFKTDKDPNKIDSKTNKPFTPYAMEVVRECFIEGKLRGFHAIGNEWNIIADGFYACKNGFRRKVQTWPGLTDFKDSYDVPRLSGDKGAIVKCRATWRKNGTADSLECEIPVKVNSFMGADAILGKAERKLLKRVHDRLAGVNTPEADVDDEPKPQSGGQGESDSSEAHNLASGGSTPPPATSPQLAEIVVGAGFTFDDFVKWGRESGHLTPDREFGSFAELPETLSLRLIRAKAGLVDGLNKLRAQ